MRGNEPLEIYPNRNRLLFFLVFTGVFLLVSILIMLNLEALQYGVLRLTALIVGFLGCMGFGYAFLFNVMRYNRPRPLIKATPEKLEFHVSPLLYGSCEWSNVSGYGLIKYAGRKMVRVQLDRPHDMLNGVGGLRRLRLKGNLTRIGTPFVLPAGLLPDDPATVLKELQQYGADLVEQDQ